MCWDWGSVATKLPDLYDATTIATGRDFLNIPGWRPNALAGVTRGSHKFGGRVVTIVRSVPLRNRDLNRGPRHTRRAPHTSKSSRSAIDVRAHDEISHCPCRDDDTFVVVVKFLLVLGIPYTHTKSVFGNRHNGLDSSCSGWWRRIRGDSFEFCQGECHCSYIHHIQWFHQTLTRK